MIDFNFDQNCYGCAACASVCPTHAISMKHNQQGFAMPEIDTESCVACSSCERVCPHLNLYSLGTTLQEAVCKAAYRTSEDRMQSSSGGIVAVITEQILRGGYSDRLWMDRRSGCQTHAGKYTRRSGYVQNQQICTERYAGGL